MNLYRSMICLLVVFSAVWTKQATDITQLSVAKRLHYHEVRQRTEIVFKYTARLTWLWTGQENQGRVS